MKICFITPGDIPVPPDGWGAIETVVWNQYNQLKNIGYDVKIINSRNKQEILNLVKEFNPDIVHLHYGQHYELMPYFKCRKIVTNHDGSFLASQKFHYNLIHKYLYDCEFFILTNWERDFLIKIGISPNKIKILPNGVDFQSFKIFDKPKYENKSICLGKIDSRKNQAFLQSLNCDVYFAGTNCDPKFNPLDDSFLGSWNRNQVFSELTNYCNLVLLSNLELHPLVCMEALSAGLGLVISENSSQNLDKSKKFISIIPQKSIGDSDLVKSTILENRKICKSIDRKEILNYAKSFCWENIIKKYQSYL